MLSRARALSRLRASSAVTAAVPPQASALEALQQLAFRFWDPESAQQAHNFASSSRDGAEESPVISIDRTGLVLPQQERQHQGVGHTKQPETEVTKHLKALIQFRGGPITVAEYMSEVLTNPVGGYYINREVFGPSGDFVTSPEISQLFGEIVGVWCVALWQQLGSPGRLRLVELGPGRGTLMADLLRGTSSFGGFRAALSVHLVEVSNKLRHAQFQALHCQGEADNDGNVVAGSSRLGGCKVSWHRSLEELPTGTDAGPTIYIAHEFFDALPVHQFQRTDVDSSPPSPSPPSTTLSSLAGSRAAAAAGGGMAGGGAPRRQQQEGRGGDKAVWRERLVDIDDGPGSQYHFRMVVSRGPTAASKLALERRLEALSETQSAELRQAEVSPQAMAVAESLAKRVAAEGGAALLVDYGRGDSEEGDGGAGGGPYPDSLAAIRSHDVVPLLDSPGSADLSAWVDFGALRLAAEGSGEPVRCYGPITQQHFLLSMGIGMRLQSLMDSAETEEQADALEAGARRLVEGDETDGMGESYKVFVIAPAAAPTPLPFEPPRQGQQ